MIPYIKSFAEDMRAVAQGGIRNETVALYVDADYSHLEHIISATMLSHLWAAGALQDMKKVLMDTGTNTGRLK